MTQRLQRQMFRRLSMKSLVVRVLCLGLFAWVTVYNPLHLVLERHSEPHHQPASVAQVALSTNQPDSDHGSHKSHSGSDHKIRATPQSQASVEACPTLLCAFAAAEIPPPPFITLFLIERVNPPGMDVPAPLLPRAPPVS